MLTTPRVLVADSDGVVLALVSFILQRQGYAVDAVMNPEDALRLMTESAYDAMIVDLALAGILEFASDDTDRASRMILISAHDHENEVPVHATLRKPLELGELLETVRKCVLPADRRDV